jgi:DNA polymerase/3'-5' exonuclease PolX
MSDKKKHPARIARAVADKIVEALKPVCMRIEIAGSLRRQKAEVGDIEILYIPKTTLIPDPQDLFGDRKIEVNAADLIIHTLIARGSLAKRTNVLDRESWGQWNKLAVAVKTDIPVDFFATTERAWWNYLVCRTGSSEMNTRIAVAAKFKGYRWSPSPTGVGFERVRADGCEEYVQINNEREVFDFVGIPYLEPHQR